MSVIKPAGARFFLMALFLTISNPVSATVLGSTDILKRSEPDSVGMMRAGTAAKVFSCIKNTDSTRLPGVGR